MRRLVVACIGFLAVLSCTSRASAAPVPPPDTTVTTTTTVPGELPPARGPLVVVPPGCAVPAPARAVFVGTILVVDDPVKPSTYRFRVDTLLAGTLDGFIVPNPEIAADLVDVRYGDEARFLEVGQQYLVGVAVQAETGLLVSTVREAAPLFGGDAVIGADDSDIDCPRVSDPVRTLTPDGGSVDTGVLTPLRGEGRSLLLAVITPFGIAFVALLALVLLKHLFFAVGRSLRDMGDSTARAQVQRATRRHQMASGADQAGH